jgi:hypothetical protein
VVGPLVFPGIEIVVAERAEDDPRARAAGEGDVADRTHDRVEVLAGEADIGVGRGCALGAGGDGRRHQRDDRQHGQK